jgi:hypothetical protein
MQDSSHLTIILCSSVIQNVISQKQKVNRKNYYYYQLSHLHPAARQFCRSTYTITDITIK